MTSCNGAVGVFEMSNVSADAFTSDPVLFVASGGGHLEELLKFRDRLVPMGNEIEWMTPNSVHAESLLRGQTVHFTGYVGPREYKSMYSLFRQARRVLLQRKFSAVISTGAAIAVPAFIAARRHRIPCHYIESAARALRPSLTGKIVQRIPRINLYTQYEVWQNRKWHFSGSVFDEFKVEDLPVPRDCNRVVVTLGTMQQFGFRRAVKQVKRVLDSLGVPSANVLWQTGCTDVSGIEIQAYKSMPAAQLREAISNADLVIAHAGVGSALTSLERGKAPILLPREARFSEHIDDHQAMIAAELASRGLAIACNVEDFDAEKIAIALGVRIVENASMSPFRLLTEGGHREL